MSILAELIAVKYGKIEETSSSDDGVESLRWSPPERATVRAED